MARSSYSPSTISEWLSARRRSNAHRILPETQRAIFDDRNALTGRELIAFVEKNSHYTPRIVILSDLLNISPPPKIDVPLVLNLTHDPQRGTHWSVLFSRNGKVYMFDSYKVDLRVLPPEWRKVTRRWNSCGFQNQDTVVCGQYTALAIVFPHLFKGRNSFTKCTGFSSKRGSKSLVNDANVYLLYHKMS